jgi:hypothetical protein
VRTTELVTPLTRAGELSDTTVILSTDHASLTGTSPSFHLVVAVRNIS